MTKLSLKFTKIDINYNENNRTLVVFDNDITGVNNSSVVKSVDFNNKLSGDKSLYLTELLNNHSIAWKALADK